MAVITTMSALKSTSTLPLRWWFCWYCVNNCFICFLLLVFLFFCIPTEQPKNQPASQPANHPSIVTLYSSGNIIKDLNILCCFHAFHTVSKALFTGILCTVTTHCVWACKHVSVCMYMYERIIFSNHMFYWHTNLMSFSLKICCGL